VAKTFTEQVANLTEPYARRTLPLRRMLETIALALAGRPGVRLATRLGLAVSRDSLPRLLRALPDPPAGMVTVLGVDDFATKRGQSYATILIDHHGHRPIEVLPDRDADTLAARLTAHPEVQIITRDRSGAYADAAARGAPQATQCADRWHLWKNLGEAVEKTVVAHRGCLPDPEPPKEGQADGTGRASDNTTTGASLCAPQRAPEPATTRGAPEIKSRLEDRFQQRYAQVQALRAHGKGMRTIGEELDLDRKTVRRFLQATSVEELLAKTASQATLLEKYKPYLHQRWNEGCTNISELMNEIRDQGYQGSARTLYRYLQPFRTTRTAPTPAAIPPTIRQITGWIMRNPENLDDQDEQRLAAILARCPELEATRRHVGAFAHMIRDLRGDLLPDWMDRARGDNLPALNSFVTGLQRDQSAVTAGLTLPWNNGPTEGTVNRIKAIKRSMFGRAKFDTLRKRILIRA
jgi:transposase